MADWFARIAAQRLGPALPLRPALLPALAPRRPGSAIASVDPEFSDDTAFAARDARRTAPSALSPPVLAPSALRAMRAAASAPATPAAKSESIAAHAGFKEPSAIPARDDASRSERDARSTWPNASPPNASTPQSRAPIDDARPRTSAVVSAALSATVARSTAPPLAADRAAALRPADPMSTPARAPVVHVHIDRLEVRAPATPSRPAPALRSRAKSADTLADYLRAGARR